MSAWKKAWPLLLCLFLVACSTVPLTGRRQLTLIPASQLQSMSYSQYDQFLKSNKLSKNRAETQKVKRVGAKIQKAVEQYMASQGLSDELAGYNWEFNLVDSDQINAWAMPGGKVVIYEGILPVAGDEAGLAVVIGHEIAHAVAGHGNERMSQGLLQQAGGMALAVALKEEPEATQALWMKAYGVGTQVGAMLPFSRLHEREADRLGMIFMAMAGYDPARTADFWTRMAAMKKGGAPPEFLSTHPSDATRIRQVRENLPEAMRYYKK